MAALVLPKGPKRLSQEPRNLLFGSSARAKWVHLLARK
jgi:hypothetical protein